jgi:Ca2+-transporting ATPase
VIEQKKLIISKYKNVGLSSNQAKDALKQYGPNTITGKKPPGDLYFLFKQFKNPLVLVLLIAIIVTSIMGHFTDSIVIALAVLVNTALGFIQERKAFKSLESLKKVVNHNAFVIRDENRIEIDVSSIVPGDVIVVYEGDKIPADGVVIENNDVFIAEAILTGESVPVEKHAIELPKEIHSITELLSKNSSYISKSDSIYKTFMGTVVTSGSAKILVTHTSMQTQLGNIASHIEDNQETVTPLEKKLDDLARFIAIGVISLSILIFIVGVKTNRDPVEMFTTSVAIAVAAIPEGLVIGLTAILAIGMNKILKRKGLVRSLVAAETLGSVTTVCIDKTGTLTEGKMRVSELKTNNEDLLYKASTLANDRKDPIEIARWNWAQSFAVEQKKLIPPEQLTAKYLRDKSLPFSVERRFLAVLIKNEIFLSGAPEEMLDRSSITVQDKAEYQKAINNWATAGKRLIGFGYIKEKDNLTALKTFQALKKNTSKTVVEWVGLMAFDDPIRKSVKETIKKTLSAGVNIKIITGDFSSTAISVMKQIGLPVTSEQYMEGTEVESLSIEELQKRLPRILLFARTKPAHKLKIVTALKNNGEVVGMMGDGVNDAPALATADIGIVVANASEVAKESSELILLDSNMNTIVAAIEEGRAMFDNLKKVTLYLLSDSFSELFIIIVSILAGIPLPITAVQILWINLIDDGLPNLALTIDPKADDLLKRKPLSRSAKLIDTEMLLLILIVSVTTAAGSLLAFKIFLPLHGIEVARTIVFAILSIDSLLYVFSCRSLEKNIWQDHPFKNPALVFSVLFGLVLTLLSIYLPPLQRLLGTTSLALSHWTMVGTISISVIIIIEFFKWIWNKFNGK